MPTIQFAGQSVECPPGANLRTVLLRARLPLYNGAARAVHCRGLGSCGTCAVRIEGEVSERTAVENVRFALPPHDRESGLRLACQCKVLGDLKVTKYEGLFGQGPGISQTWNDAK
jgi:ferredoxin